MTGTILLALPILCSLVSIIYCIVTLLKMNKGTFSTKISSKRLIGTLRKSVTKPILRLQEGVLNVLLNYMTRKK